MFERFKSEIEAAFQESRFEKESWNDEYVKLTNSEEKKTLEFFLEKNLTKRLEKIEPEIVVFKRVQDGNNLQKELLAAMPYSGNWCVLVCVIVDENYSVYANYSILDDERDIIYGEKLFDDELEKFENIKETLLEEILEWNEVRLAKISGLLKMRYKGE
jgi:hypothetical protein